MTSRDVPAERPFQSLKPETKPTPISLETHSGWEQQFVRMRRWRDRIMMIAQGAVNDDLMDYCLAFFMTCYSLRDWLIHSGGVKKEIIDLWISRNPAMQLCHDICTRAKHFKVSRPKLDGGFQIVRDFAGRSPEGLELHSLVILFNGYKFPLADIVQQCDAFWEMFVWNNPAPQRLPR